MKLDITFPIFISIASFSCNDFEKRSAPNAYVMELNAQIRNAYSSSSTWVSNPETIAKHFFPVVSHDSFGKPFPLGTSQIGSDWFLDGLEQNDFLFTWRFRPNERETQNAERETQNAERETVNPKRVR